MSLFKRNRVPARLLLNPVHFLSLGFGSGLSPFAPGTAGTLVAIPVYWLMAPLTIEYYLGLVFIFFLAGIFLCGKTTRRLGSHDHSAIVWDEIVGYLITMLMIPFSLEWAIIGFFVFRLFDVWKPWPVSVMDKKIHGGFGIMLDDVAAAIYSLLSMHALIYLWENVR